MLSMRTGTDFLLGQELFGRELVQEVHDDRAVLREKLLGSVPQGIHVDGNEVVRGGHSHLDAIQVL